MTIRVSLVGPTGGGKTTYLASLLQAPYAMRGGRHTSCVRPADIDDGRTRELERTSARLLLGEPPAATTLSRTHALTLDLPGSRLFGVGAETLTLSIADAPGGALFPTPGTPRSTDAENCLAVADSVAFLIPADVGARPFDLSLRTLHLADWLRSRQQRGFPLLRLAVVLTMAELLVAHECGDARQALASLDARATITAILGREASEALQALVAPGADGWYLVSAMGFDSTTGRPAAVRTQSGWRLPIGSVETINRWRPFRVLAPLEFLARGVAWEEVE